MQNAQMSSHLYISDFYSFKCLHQFNYSKYVVYVYTGFICTCMVIIDNVTLMAHFTLWPDLIHIFIDLKSPLQTNLKVIQ